MLLIIGTIRLPANRLEAARPAMAAMVEATRAETGCLQYNYSEDVLDPGLIHITECWTDRAALDNHLQTAHIAEWRAHWPALGIGERNLRLYQAGEAERI